MKTAILTVSTLLCLNLAMSARPQASQESVAARTAAKAWLALVDSGHYDESWKQMAKAAKARLTKAEWVTDLNKARGPVGKVLSRKFKNATYAKNPPGNPAGEYEVLHYITDFKNLKRTDETVSLMRGKDGKWRVTGYFFKPAD